MEPGGKMFMDCNSELVYCGYNHFSGNMMDLHIFIILTIIIVDFRHYTVLCLQMRDYLILQLANGRKAFPIHVFLTFSGKCPREICRVIRDCLKRLAHQKGKTESFCSVRGLSLK